MTSGHYGNAGGRAGRLRISRPEAHAFKGQLVERWSWRTAVSAATLPAKLAPADVIGQNVDDVGPLPEPLLKTVKLCRDLLIILCSLALRSL